MTEINRAYPMIAINKENGDHFQIRIDSAPVTPDRWVHVSCGVHVVKADTPTERGPVVVQPSEGDESVENLLALSWQPAFCETKPNKAECKVLNDGGLPITETQLSIHGLWPQPKGKFYCGVSDALIELDKSKQWLEIPALDLDAETNEALMTAMPGMMSGLERHEWVKHGSCHRGDGGANEYYDDTLLVTDAINGAIADFLSDHVGAEVNTADIRALMDNSFGDGAGDRVQVKCQGDGGRVLIQELRINLKGVINSDTSVADLLLAAETLSPGCPKGIVDPAGLQ